MTSLALQSAPVNQILDVATVKSHLRISGDDEDTLLTGLIDTAREFLDGRNGILGRALITQTWDLYLDDFPADDVIELPFSPAQSITEITYIDYAGNTQTLDTDAYSVNIHAYKPFIVLNIGYTWPVTRDIINAVKVRGVYGYGDDASDVPAPIRHAALLLVGHLYENREATTTLNIRDLPMAFDSLIAPYRVLSI